MIIVADLGFGASLLRDDSLDYVRRAVAAGVDARVNVGSGMAHGFLGSVGHLEAADAALKLLGAYPAERLSYGNDRSRSEVNRFA